VPHTPHLETVFTSTVRRWNAGIGCRRRILYDQIAIGRDVEIP
jgi:hypothetical protein